jgi:hypothetical protein
MANLTPEQRTALEEWAADGATLNDVQQRLKAQFDVSLTYLDARLLLLELQVKLKDKPRDEPKPEEPAPIAPPQPIEDAALPNEAAPAGGPVSISIDEITLPGSLVSGKVTFSDSKTVGWYLDQSGRLGLRGQEPGYRPPAADVPVFQAELDRVLVQAGF